MNNKQVLQARLFEISGMIEAAYLISGNDDLDSILHNVRESIDTLIPLLNDDDECPGCGCPSHDRCHGCGKFHD